jgi:GNAT superfamily N-acetyltransferase
MPGITIEHMEKADIEPVVVLVREVYNEFVAPGYAPRGNDTFYGFIREDAMLQRLDAGSMVFTARESGAITGMIEIRDGSHISLFYVKKDCQGRGIGSALFRHAVERIREFHPGTGAVTVNSSPFAAPIYESLGFVKVSELQEKNGIKYVPLEFKIS